MRIPFGASRVAAAAGLAVVLAVPLGTSPGGAANNAILPPPIRVATLVARPNAAVLLSIARAGRRLIAVGERGVIVASDDDGRTWRQIVAPTSVTLTAVAFVSAATGWAVGHFGIVLTTHDGGATWTRQLDGAAALAIARRAAARATGPNAAGLRALVRQLGPESPWLTVHFFDERHGLVAGANGLLFATTDGGATWTSRMPMMHNPDGLHYYAFGDGGGDLFLAGEQGRFYRSIDRGATFAPVRVPYGGTFFSVASARPHEFLVGGLRGNVFFSRDDGAHVVQVASPVPVSISHIGVRRDGTYELTNQAGSLFTYRPGETDLRFVTVPPLPPLSAVIDAADGAPVAVGAGGVTRVASADTATPAAAR
jgi:photosystem II stability/assembly factor-like uncharacterized protein